MVCPKCMDRYGIARESALKVLLPDGGPCIYCEDSTFDPIFFRKTDVPAPETVDRPVKPKCDHAPFRNHLRMFEECLVAHYDNDGNPKPQCRSCPDCGELVDGDEYERIRKGNQ